MGEDEIPETERLLERRAVRFDVLLGALQICRHSDELKSDVDLALFGRRLFWRRPLIPKFAVADFAAGIGDVTARSQSDSAKQHHRSDAVCHGR